MTNPYGYEHQQDRAARQTEIDRNPVRCACTGSCGKHAGRCPTIIGPGTPWHLGHRTAVAAGGNVNDRAPWCQPCNSVDGVKVREKLKREPRRSRDWGE